MSLSDAEFDEQLDGFVKSTVDLVAKVRPTEFVPTVFLVYDERVRIEALVNEGDDEPQIDLYELLFGFGKELAKHNNMPDAVFVVSRFLLPPDDSACIFVSGCTPDGRKNGAALMLAEGDGGAIRITNTVFLRLVDEVEFEGRTGAGEVIRGFMESPVAGKKPWWKWW